MNARELIDRLNWLSEHVRDFDEKEAGVVLCRKEMGGTPVAGIDSALCGADWDRNKLMLFPKKRS